MIIKSWGNLSNYKTRIFTGQNRLITPLSIGNLRSYGDQAYSKNILIKSIYNRILYFDKKNGLIKCESGITIKDLCEIIHPYGFILPVVPGSGLVTIGGAVSNDIHGKSHHLNGSFCNHVKKITVIYKGIKRECSLIKNQKLFKSFVGGMGLVGTILNITIKLQKSKNTNYLVESIPFFKLDDFFYLSEHSKNFSDSVAWIDCQHINFRGIFFRAKLVSYKNKHKKNFFKIRYPFSHSFSIINRFSVYIISKIYFYFHFINKKKIVSYSKFHHPLDSIYDWNNAYGSNGFYQFQCVIPKKHSLNGIREILDIIRDSGEGSFINVLKNFGPIKSFGYLSFPIEGTTLAIDFSNKKLSTTKLIKRLYDKVIKLEGKVYPAKDALMTSFQFKKSYPHYKKFLKYRDFSITSSMSKRYNI